MLKTCSRCNQKLDTSCFNKDKGKPDGLCTICKNCRAIIRKQTNSEIAEYNKRYREEHSDYFKQYNVEHKEQALAYRKSHKAEKAEYDKKYQSSSEYKKQKAEYDKQYYQQNKSKIKEYTKLNKDKIAERNKKYRLDNSESLREKDREYYKKVVKNDPMLMINKNISSAICESLKGTKSEQHWEDLVGYSLEDLTKHLESLFQPGMTWENHTRKGWHIDHIVPKNVFNFNSYNDIEFKACWSLENLRPIWCIDNWQRPKDGSDIEITKEQLINKVKERLNRC